MLTTVGIVSLEEGRVPPYSGEIQKQPRVVTSLTKFIIAKLLPVIAIVTNIWNVLIQFTFRNQDVLT